MTTPVRETQPTRERPPRVTGERPLVLTGAVVIVILVAAGGAAAARVALDLSTDAVGLAAEVVLALVAVGVLTRWRAWRHVGFRRLEPLRDLRLFWIPLFPVLPAAVAALSGQGLDGGGLQRLGLWLALAALVGFVEEVAFRGLILQALAPRGAWRAAVVSAVLFGLMHAVNLLFGADPGATLLQVGYATAMGFAFAAVALRTGTIWPLVVIHALIDVVGFITADGTTATGVAGPAVLVAAVYATMFTVYGALVLRAVADRR